MADDEIDNTDDPGDADGPLDAPPTEALQIVEATPVEPLTPLDHEPAVIEPAADLPVAEAVPTSDLTPQQKRMAIIGAAVAAVLLLVIIIVAGGGDHEKSVTSGSTTTTEVERSTTTEPTDTSTTAVDTSTTAVTDTTTPPTNGTGPLPPLSAAESGPYKPLVRVSASSVIYSPDGRTMLTSGQALNPDGPPEPAVLRNANTGAVIATYGNTQTHGDALSPDGSKVLTSDYYNNTITVWPVGGGTGVTIPTGSPRWSGFSTDGSKVFAVTSNPDWVVTVWDAATGTQVTSFNASSAVFSPDGSQILSGPLLRSATTGEVVRTYVAAEPTGAALLSPDGNKVLAISASGIASMFDAASGDVLFTVTGVGSQDSLTVAVFGNTSPSAAFSPDNSTFVTCGSDGTITRWNSSTGEMIASLAAPTDLVEGPTIDAWMIAFSADGSKLAVTYSGESFYDVTVVWNVASGSRLIHVTDLYQPTFSPDGTRLAGVSDAANRINTYAV